mmetsp:Transcript_65427/g.151827  ORF Transcript_65427/g.151827 Transcript_65427/m.151827 type:complete len:299 (-) Transcript_65427:41-937(-)
MCRHWTAFAAPGPLCCILACAGWSAGQLQIVGAGLPRTGTESLSEALAFLGYTPNNHGHCNPPSNCQRFACMRMKGGSFADLGREIALLNFTQVSDEPLCLFYREFADWFPESKIVLTVRDSAEEWLRSFLEMQELTFHGRSGVRVEVFMKNNFWGHCDQLPHSLFGCDVFTENVSPEERRSCLEGYHEHTRKVKEAIPPERLLIFNVKEGWEPLCKFLGRPVPSRPFPHNNAYLEYLRAKEQEERKRRQEKRSFVLEVLELSLELTVPVLLFVGFKKRHLLRESGCCVWRWLHRRSD